MTREPGGDYRCPNCRRTISNGYPGSLCYCGGTRGTSATRMRPNYLKLVKGRRGDI